MPKVPDVASSPLIDSLLGVREGSARLIGSADAATQMAGQMTVVLGDGSSHLLPDWIQLLLGIGGSTLKPYTSVAAMNADLSPADGTLAAVTNDADVTKVFPRLVYRKNGAPGTGSWLPGADTFLPIVSLAAPLWMAPGNDQIFYIDRGNAFGAGTNRLLFPRVWTIYRNGSVMDAATVANTASVVPGLGSFCELAYSHAGLWLVYWDSGDNLIKCLEKAGWAAAGFPAQIGEIFPLALINGSQVYTQLRYHDLFDSREPVIVPNGPLIHLEAEGKLLVPAVRQMIGTSINTIAPDPATGLAYWEISVQTGAPLTPNAHYFDVVSGQPLSVAANHPAPVGYKSAGPLLARSHNNVVHSPFAVVSRKTGGLAPNQLPNGSRPVQAPLQSANAAEIALDDAAVTALGFAFGIHSTVLNAATPVHAGDVMPDTRPGQPFFARCIVTIGASDAWTNVIARAVFLPSAGAQPVSVNLQLEKILSSRSRIYSIAARVPSQDFFGATVFNWYSYGVGCWVNNTPAIDPVVSACQFSVADGAAWISRNDFTSQQTMQTRLNAVETVIAPINPDILIPTDIWGVDKRPFQIYPGNLQVQRSSEATFVTTVSAVDGGAYALPVSISSKGDTVDIDPGRFKTTGAGVAYVEVRKYTDTAAGAARPLRRWRKSVAFHVAPASFADGVTAGKYTAGQNAIRVLVAGNSIVNNNLAHYARLKLAAFGFAPTFIGTIDNPDASGTKAEGRPGKRLTHYTYQNTTFGPVAPGGEAAYLALTNAQRQDLIPMLRAATGSDPAGRVFSGYIYDLRFFLDRFGFADPDIVLYEFPTNDILNNVALGTIMTGLDILVQQTRLALPAAQIGIGVPTPARRGGSPGDDKWESGWAPFIKSLIAYPASLGDANVKVVPFWAHLNSEANYPLDVVSTDPQTGVINADCNDWIHTAQIGQHQLAEQVLAWIACRKAGV